MSRKQIKQQNIAETVVLIAIVAVLGVLSSFFYARFDLTSDKRFSISKHTKQLLDNVDDAVLFKVYLDGDLPAGFVKLRTAVSDILEEFRAYGGANIQYEFVNPSESENANERNRVHYELYQKGLDPVNLQVKDKDGGTSQRIIFPGIVVSYKGREVAVNVLKNYVSASSSGNLQTSIQSLEYNLTFAIIQLMQPTAPIIGFLRGHGELEVSDIEDISYSLGQFYSLRQVDANEELMTTDSVGALTYKLIVIAKPTEQFSERDKFFIDQYVMRGGRVLWLIDNVMASMDSLTTQRVAMAVPADLNLDDQLFNYGVRMNPNLIQDIQCAMIPVNTALVGQQPQFVPAPWIFSPVVTPNPNHPMTKNLDMVRLEFVSSVDTVGQDANVQKTILLASSNNSRLASAPVQIDLAIVGEAINPEMFNRAELPIAVLLEGSFRSVFTNRALPQGCSRQMLQQQSMPTRMVVVSDGDIIRNQFKVTDGRREPLPLGYDRLTKQTFGNKEFLLNAINYLCGFDGLMESRSKEFKLRMLDKAELQNHRLYWQTVNVALPIVLIVIAGIAFNVVRRKKFQKNA